jgi:glycosyltransferase involved in cell wall biosynthesis
MPAQMTGPRPKELAVVMPVYNEAACIESVVHSWLTILNEQDIKFTIFVINDGSRDGTETCLAKFSSYPEIHITSKANSGHGPTILMGYKMAVEEADWVFQVDSDDEMSPIHFKELWDKRTEYSALFGVRTGRSQNFGRKIISYVSRVTIKLLYGNGVTDVNVPFRLIRAPLLEHIITRIPKDTFAPNIIISGALAAAGVSIYNHPVPHEGRRTGSVSIVRWKLWKASLRSFKQTVLCRPHVEPH